MGGRAAADWDRAWRLEQPAAPALCARVPTFAPATPAAPTGGRLTPWRTAGRSAPSRLWGSGGRGGAGGGPIRPRGSLPPACGVAGLREAGQTPSTTPAPCALGAPTQRPGPQHSQIPEDKLLFQTLDLHSQVDLRKGWQGCFQGKKASGSEEIVYCKGRACGAFCIPGHRLAGQVFAPLGSVDPSQALPGAHKETNRAHVSNPSATGDVKHSGEAAACPPPSQ